MENFWDSCFIEISLSSFLSSSLIQNIIITVMGMTPKTPASANTQIPTIAALRNYQREMIRMTSPSTEGRQNPLPPPSDQSGPTNGRTRTWSLPLESLVLQNGSPNDDIALNFLHVYPDILRKFPGPPCEALARTITYLQATFTESPGFHPYVTHLPCRSLPLDETTGRQVAEALERQLIRILQNLFPFFNGDVSVVRGYINICPAELIPRPYFVVPSGTLQPLSPSNMLLKGIHGFNNHVVGGDRVWQDPVPQLPAPRVPAEQNALATNIQRCTLMITRKLSLQRMNVPAPPPRASTVPPRRAPPPQPTPMRPQFSNNLQPSAISPPNPAPVQTQFQPQQFARQETPLPGSYPIVPPRPAQISISPPPQMQPSLSMQQPYAGPVHIPARVSSPRPKAAATQTMPLTTPLTTDSATNTDDQTIKEEIARLTAQMAHLVEIVEKDRQKDA